MLYFPFVDPVSDESNQDITDDLADTSDACRSSSTTELNYPSNRQRQNYDDLWTQDDLVTNNQVFTGISGAKCVLDNTSSELDFLITFYFQRYKKYERSDEFICYS